MEYSRLWKQILCFVFFIGIIFTLGCGDGLVEDEGRDGAANRDRENRKNRSIF